MIAIVVSGDYRVLVVLDERPNLKNQSTTVSLVFLLCFLFLVINQYSAVMILILVDLYSTCPSIGHEVILNGVFPIAEYGREQLIHQ